MAEKVIDILDGDMVLRLVQECVSERGEDFVYAREQECAYVHNVTYQDDDGFWRMSDEGDYTPGCLIGMALNKGGIPLHAFIDPDINNGVGAAAAIAYLTEAGYIGRVTDEAEKMLVDMQDHQDHGFSWGLALKAGLRRRSIV